MKVTSTALFLTLWLTLGGFSQTGFGAGGMATKARSSSGRGTSGARTYGEVGGERSTKRLVVAAERENNLPRFVEALNRAKPNSAEANKMAKLAGEVKSAITPEAKAQAIEALTRGAHEVLKGEMISPEAFINGRVEFVDPRLQAAIPTSVKLPEVSQLAAATRQYPNLSPEILRGALEGAGSSASPGALASVREALRQINEILGAANSGVPSVTRNGKVVLVSALEQRQGETEAAHKARLGHLEGVVSDILALASEVSLGNSEWMAGQLKQASETLASKGEAPELVLEGMRNLLRESADGMRAVLTEALQASGSRTGASALESNERDLVAEALKGKNVSEMTLGQMLLAIQSHLEQQQAAGKYLDVRLETIKEKMEARATEALIAKLEGMVREGRLEEPNMRQFFCGAPYPAGRTPTPEEVSQGAGCPVIADDGVLNKKFPGCAKNRALWIRAAALAAAAAVPAALSAGEQLITTPAHKGMEPASQSKPQRPTLQ